MDEASARATAELLSRTSAFTGTGFFEALARAIHEVLGADRVFVAKLDHDGEDLVTLACTPSGAPIPRSTRGTALEEVVRHAEPIARTPDDDPWPGTTAGFVALPTRGQDERTLGVLVAIGRSLDLVRARAALVPFARRIGVELERIAEDDTRRANEARAFERQRLERVAALAGGIAHDFNNVLVGILGNVELALLRVGDDSKIRSHLEAIQRSSLRAADLTRQLLTYAGKTHYEVQPLRMDEVLLELRGLFGATKDEHTNLSYAIEEGLPSVLADRAKVSQLFVALVANAAEALGAAGGTIRVSARRAVLDDETLYRPEPPDASRRYVEIAIADDGPGMSEETRARLFEPFFSTKAASGRGLGLAASLGIVIAHEGRVAIETEEGRGTTVRVLLPTADSKPPPRFDARAAKSSAPPSRARATSVPAPARDPGNALRFLVVDDDPTVRDIARTILEGGGFEVETAHDGAAAIAAFDAARPSFDGVVLDLRMPRIRGIEVLRHVRRVRGELPVVVITAFHDELDTLAADAAVRVVPKPFVAGELLEAIQSLIRRA